jgi:hypothetical protein
MSQTTTTTREQLWSHAGIKAVINAPGISRQQREYVSQLVPSFNGAPEIDADTEKLSVEYHRSKHGYGRRFERPRGLQGSSRLIRRICSAKYYRDWDIENAYPVILEGKLRAEGIPCPTLSAYTTQRDKYLSDVMNKLNVTRAVAKELFIISLHCGDWHNHDDAPAGATHHTLDAFSAEIRGVSQRLASLAGYVELRNIVETDPDKTNKMGSFVSLVCQVDEDKAIAAIEEALADQGEQVDVLVFDGVMSRSMHSRNVDTVELSRRASAAIQISIVVREKSFDILASDLEVLHKDDVQAVLDASGLSAQAQEDLLAAMGPSVVLPDEDVFRMPTQITEEHDDEHVLPYKANVQTQMTLIGASMGLGKTHQLRELLKHNTDLGRVLIITARQQQAYSAQGVFEDIKWDDGSHGFKNYLDCADGTLFAEDKLVVQYESLHRLCDMVNGMEEIRPYDLVIIDEVRSALTQSQCAATNGQRLLFNHQILQSLLKNCRSICLDADMEVDGAVWEFVSQILPPERIQFHRYTYVALRREIVMVSESEWLRMMSEDLANGRKIGLPCRSKMKMNDILGMDEVNTRGLLRFDSDSTKEEMEKLKNINQNLDGIQLLAFTSKVTTAADIQGDFHAIYVHGCAVTGPTPRDTLQMIGRFRKVFTCKVISCLPPVRDAALGVTYEGERKAVLGRKCQAIRMQDYLASTGFAPRGVNLGYVPHPLLGLTAHARVESNDCFTKNFLRQVRRKGWRIDFLAPADTSSAEEIQGSLDATHAEHKDEREAHKLQVARAVQTMTQTQREDETERLRQLQQAHEITPEGRVWRNTLHVAVRLPPGALGEIDPEPLAFAADDINALYRVSAVMRNSLAEQSHSDASALAKAPSGEHAVFRGAASREILSVLRIMGFNGICDTDTRVSLGEFQTHTRKALIAGCIAVFSLLDIDPPRVRVSPRQHITLAKNMLRLVKLRLQSRQSIHRGSARRIRQYWLAHECEGFFQLARDFNPYPTGPPTPTNVRRRRPARTMTMKNSRIVAGIVERESSSVFPLPHTLPHPPADVVYVNVPRSSVGHSRSMYSSRDGFIVSSVVPHMHPLSSTASTDVQRRPLVSSGAVGMQVESGHGAHEMAPSVDYHIPSNSELDDIQAESSEDFGDLGCYADGPSMQDESD